MIPYKNRPQFETVAIPFQSHWEAEMPVGDPFGGPAYGQKEGLKKWIKPIVAVAAVVATGGAALGAFAAAGGALTASTVFAGMAFAGSALSLVGMATGNEKLTKIGGIASLAGGVGMLGTNIAAAASSGAGFGESFSKGWADTVKQFEDGAKTGWEKLTGSLSGSPAPAATDAAGGLKATGAQSLTAPADAGGLVGKAASGVEGSLYGGPADPRLASGSGISLGGATPTSGTMYSPATSGIGATSYLTPAAPAQSGGLISSAMNFAKSNPTALLIGGQALAGAAESRSQEKMMRQQIEAQQAAMNGQIARANDIGYTYPGSPSNVANVDLFANRKPTMPTYSVDPVTGMIRRNMNS